MPKKGSICSARQGRRHASGLQREGGELLPGQALVLLPIAEGETDDSPVAYCSPLRQALLDDNAGHANEVVCEADYRALKRGIEHLPPPVQ